MKVELKENICIVTKEKGDKSFHSTQWASAESTFLYHVKKELERQGIELIKKRMWKDGHLVDDEQQYLRTRKKKNCFCIYNSAYAINDAGLKFNEDEKFVLSVEKL